MSTPAVSALQNSPRVQERHIDESPSCTWYGRVVTWIIDAVTLEVCKIIILVLKFLGYTEDTLRFFRYIESVEEEITHELHHFGKWPERYPEDPSRLVENDPKMAIIGYAIEDLLRSVNGSISSLTEETQEIIRKIGRRYDSLNLHGSQLTVESIKELGHHFPDLEKLSLIHCNIGHDQLQELSRLTSLKELSLEGVVTITDHLLPLFNQFESLVSLNLSSCHGILKSASLRHLVKIKKLQIGKSACIFAGGIYDLAKLTQLIRLDLTGSDHIGDSAIKELIPLVNLRILNLSGTQITDAVFHHLLQFTNLRKVILKNCPGITSDGFTRFMDQKPDRLAISVG